MDSSSAANRLWVRAGRTENGRLRPMMTPSSGSAAARCRTAASGSKQRPSGRGARSRLGMGSAKVALVSGSGENRCPGGRGVGAAGRAESARSPPRFLYLLRMTPDEFRAHGHELVDWMADYLRDVGSRRIVPQVRPGDIRRALPDAPPDEAEPFERVMADFERL